MLISYKVKDPIRLFLALTILLTLPALSQAADNPYIIKYPFKNAVFHYMVSGGGTSGKETLYIDGDKKAHYVESVWGNENNQLWTKQLTLTTPDFIYKINLATKTGTKIENPIKHLIGAFSKLTPEEKELVSKNLEALAINIVGNVHGKRKLEVEEVLGISADLIEIYGVKTLVWPILNIPLKWSVGEKMVTVTKIERNVRIKPSIFEIPDGIEITLDKGNNRIEINKALAQFHLMREPDAISLTRQRTKWLEDQVRREEEEDDDEYRYRPNEDQQEKLEDMELEHFGDLD